MRVSTAALYTLAALVAQDVTAKAIAAPATPAPSPEPLPATAPTDKGLTASELVAPIAAAETFPIELTATEKISVGQNEAPALPQIAEKPEAASFVPAPATLGAQPVPQASPKPSSAPVFSPPPAAVSAVERSAAPQPVPLVQTLNQADLLSNSQSGQSSVSTHASTVAVGNLTLAEIKALQQGLPVDRAKPAVATTAPNPSQNHPPSTPASLVSANLAVQATAAFGNSQAQSGETQNGETQNGETPATAAAPGQPSAATPPGQDDNQGFSLSVVDPGNHDSGSNARSYYNLTTRPVSQLSNGNVSLLFPLSIPAAITSAFGWRVHPVMGGARFHAGTDLGAPQGTPVLAALDGKVEIADMVGGYGLTVVLQHNKGTEQTLYAHLSEIFVQPGDPIKQGEAIGRVGSTGLSTGPHLHFEFRKLTQEGWTLMDPSPALEYALLHFHPSTQVAQGNSVPKLPMFFQHSGKFLETVQIATDRNATKTQQTLTSNAGTSNAGTSNTRVTQPSIATRDRSITVRQTQATARRSSASPR